MPVQSSDQRVGDDGINGAVGARDLALPHAVADHLAAAELDLLAIDLRIPAAATGKCRTHGLGGQVALDLDEEFGIGEPHPVARGGAEHGGVGGAGDLGGHVLFKPLIL